MCRTCSDTRYTANSECLRALTEKGATQRVRQVSTVVFFLSISQAIFSYLSALETRLHEAEALLGAIIASPQAESLVATLSKDPLAGQIITRVNKSVFGALGRSRPGQSDVGPSRNRRRPDKARQRMSNNEVVYSRESGGPAHSDCFVFHVLIRTCR
jgi:hypothetical protein